MGGGGGEDEDCGGGDREDEDCGGGDGGDSVFSEGGDSGSDSGEAGGDWVSLEGVEESESIELLDDSFGGESLDEGDSDILIKLSSPYSLLLLLFMSLKAECSTNHSPTGYYYILFHSILLVSCLCL